MKYAATQPQGVTGFISCSPLIQPGKKTAPGFIQYWAVRSLSMILPTSGQVNPVESKYVSRDPNVVRDHKEDPYVDKINSLATLSAVLTMGEELFAGEYKNISRPVLMTHGTEDVLTS